MDGKGSELAVLTEMVRLKGEVATLRGRLERAYERLDRVTQEREALAADLNLVAGAVCQGMDFDEWLMSQDASSAVTYSPAKKRFSIEGKSDVELALMFIAAASAG